MSSPKEIVVTIAGKETRFQMRYWRRAITYFLDAVWSQPDDQGGNTLTIRGVTLTRGESFYSISTTMGCVGLEIPTIETRVLIVDCKTTEVEVGLARLVRDRTLQQLVIVGLARIEMHIWPMTARAGMEPINATLRI